MAYAEQLQSLLAQYQADINALEKSRKPTDGFLGFGKKPGDDACHDRLDRDTAALAEQMASAPDGLADTLRLLFAAGADEAWPNYAHWSLIALQRHFLPLISRLAPAEKAELSSLYNSLFPRRQRLPLQKQVAKALQK